MEGAFCSTKKYIFFNLFFIIYIVLIPVQLSLRFVSVGRFCVNEKCSENSIYRGDGRSKWSTCSVVVKLMDLGPARSVVRSLVWPR